MIEVKHFANGQQVNPIGERENEPFPLVVEMDWINQKVEASIPPTRLSFEGKDGKLIRDRALNGMNGGVGIFEGMPYSVQLGSSSSFDTFDMYADLTNELEFFGECGVNVSVQKKQGTDWLNDVADGIPFAYLQDIGVITNADFYSVPYTINYIPDTDKLLILALSTYSLTKELIEGVKAIADRIADLTDAATPVVGVGVGAGAVAVTAYDIGNIIMAALKLVAQIAYTAAIVVALINLVEQVVEAIMPPKRFHKAIPIRLLFERFCNHLDLVLESSLLDSLDVSGNKWCYMPPKNHRGGERPTSADSSWQETGVPPVGSPIYTVGGLIRVFKSMFNADFKITNGKFQFERKDGFVVDNPYIIPNTLTDQTALVNANGFNANELAANYIISWNTDIEDKNTLDNIEGLAFQAQTVANRTSDPRLSSIKGSKDVNLPFSLPVRKDKLSAVEIAVKALASLLDTVSGNLGNPQSLSARINNRIGSLNLSSHKTTTGKIVVMAGAKLQKDQRSLVGATALWDNYHFINSFAPLNGRHEQYYLYRDQQIPFCFKDYENLKRSNRVLTEQGDRAIVENLKWDVGLSVATINYRVNKLYDRNLKVRIL